MTYSSFNNIISSGNKCTVFHKIVPNFDESFLGLGESEHEKEFFNLSNSSNFHNTKNRKILFRLCINELLCVSKHTIIQ